MFNLSSLPEKPGVYQFLDAHEHVIYVGKAKNLKKRVASYFQKNLQDAKTKALIASICNVNFIVTTNETEAFLLENTLIKKLKPYYNILFKDDKSYPYLFLSKHKFPRLTLFRGEPKKNGNYYGPYPNATTAHETIEVFQKIFGIRVCGDAIFRNRVRPCILYQIKRCTAPCVRRISEKDYANNLVMIKKLLSGQSQEIIKLLKNKMDVEAKQLNYEKAAIYRNQFQDLQKMQLPQYVVSNQIQRDLDAINIVLQNQFLVVAVIAIRKGKVVDTQTYFSQTQIQESDTNQFIPEVLSNFIAQHYFVDKTQPQNLPKQIILPIELNDQAQLETILQEQSCQKIVLKVAKRGINKHWLDMAELNAKATMTSKLKQLPSFNFADFLQELTTTFGLNQIPKQIECFDISHMRGSFTVASCVVFTQQGPDKTAYRRFNLTGIKSGDDYAALNQAIQRRYQSHPLPDLLIIDGGKGQLHAASKALVNITDCKLSIIAMAKGKQRKAGKETFYTSFNDQPIILAEDSLISHGLQRIRDEAHRFAISLHRKKLLAKNTTSILEKIKGIGPQRRRLLLTHYGNLENIKSANPTELAKLLKITQKIAAEIIAQIVKKTS